LHELFHSFKEQRSSENCLKEINSYLQENTPHLHYKDQRVNDVEGNKLPFILGTK